MSARSRARDDQFIDFASSTQQALYRQAYLLTGDIGTAEDLVQETLLKVYRVWHRGSGVDHPLAYSRRVLMNEFLARRRRPQFAVASGPHQAEIAAQNATMSDGPVDRLTLVQALGLLPPRTRAVLVLRYWEDLSIEQAAQALDCSPGTVKSTAARGLSRLRGLLGDTFEMAGVRHD